MANVYITFVECRLRQIQNCSNKKFEAFVRESPGAELVTDVVGADLENIINLGRASLRLNGEASQTNGRQGFFQVLLQCYTNQLRLLNSFQFRKENEDPFGEIHPQSPNSQVCRRKTYQVLLRAVVEYGQLFRKIR